MQRTVHTSGAFAPSTVSRTRSARTVTASALRLRSQNSQTQSASLNRSFLFQGAPWTKFVGPGELLLLDRISEGTHGSVYKALDYQSGAEVAVKKIATSGERGTVYPNAIRIEMEATIHDSVSDSSTITTFLKHIQNANSHWIVTELCNGGDLSNYIEDGKHNALHERQIAAIARTAVHMLQTCHSRGVLHGDIKASNFVIHSSNDVRTLHSTPDALQIGWLKGIDFGSSMQMGKGKCSNRVGTPTHWSPELFRRSYGLEVDLWSLGTMLYQLLIRRLPFFTKQDELALKSEREILFGITTKEVDFLSRPWEDISVECKDFLNRLLQREARKRLTAAEAAKHPFLKA